MKGLKEFPKEGWCVNNCNSMYDILIGQFPEVIQGNVKPSNGWAWNEHSFWPIRTESSKPIYRYTKIRFLVAKPVQPENIFPIQKLKAREIELRCTPRTKRTLQNLRQHCLYDIAVDYEEVLCSNRTKRDKLQNRDNPCVFAI